MNHLFISLDAYHGIPLDTHVVWFLGPDAHALHDLPKIYKKALPLRPIASHIDSSMLLALSHQY